MSVYSPDPKEDPEEVLPLDEEDELVPEEDELENEEEVEEEGGSEEEPEETQTEEPVKGVESRIDVEALRTEIVDDLTKRLEPVLGTMYNRLRQSGKDTVRAEINKTVRPQQVLLNKLVSEGRLSKEDARGMLAELTLEAEQAADELVKKAEKDNDEPLPPIAPNKASGSQPTSVQAFTDACQAILDSRGVDLNDPDAKELLTIKIPSTLSYRQALKMYSDAVEKVVQTKREKTSTSKKKPTPVETRRSGGRTESADELLGELNKLMHQSGGTFEERQARNRKIKSLNEKLNQ